MEGFEIKKLSEVDAKELAVLAHDTFKVTYEDKFEGEFDHQNFKNYLKNAFKHVKIMKEIQETNSTFFGVFENDKMIAFMKLNFLDNQTVERPDNHVEVERFYITLDKQGRGLGRYMMDWVSEWAKKKDYVKLWLRSWEKNEKGIAFYKKMGMKIVGTAEYKFEEADDIDYVIEKDLV